MSEKTELLECTHCHQPVYDKVWSDDGSKLYCCYGCKVVDELLDDDQKVIDPASLPVRKYAYLNEKKIEAKILSFNDGGYARLSIHLPAIHCSSCIYLLENLAEIEAGIQEVQVHFGKKQAVISYRKEDINLAQIAALLDYIGYPPDFQTKLGGQSPKKNRLLIQLGIAGFFFGNTMLLALPDYLHHSLADDRQLQLFFRFLMMGFSLPVIIYSARDYFVIAARSLKAGALSIDLPIALGIAVLFIRSSYEVLADLGPGYFDSLTGLVFFLLIGKWYQQKTYQNFTFDRDLRSFLPLAANQLTSHGEKPVAIDDLRKGDKIRVRQGEVLPADAQLLRQKVEIDYSYLTGESLPVLKHPGEQVYAGGRIIGAAADFELVEAVDHSYLSTLWSRESFKENSHKEEASFGDRVSRYFTPSILLIATVAAVLWGVYGDFSKAFSVFSAVLIVACPCALALAEPFASGSLMRWFGRYGFFLKNATVLRRLENITHVVFDKTGTLTLPDKIQVAWHGDQLLFADKWAIASVARNAQHPLAKPILNFLEIADSDAEQALDFEEASGEGVGARVRGHYFRLGKASFLKLSDKAGTTAVYAEKDGLVLGYFSLHQEVRLGLAEIAQSLKSHYQLSVLSGDNTAEQKRFASIFGSEVALLFNRSPHQKLEELQILQAQGQRVLMLGDGLNDAGALQQSEVGISLCEKDVNFFPASDALLQADSFAKLDRFLYLAKRNRQVIWFAFGISLAYNLVGISVAVAGLLSPLFAAILMPVSSVSVVLFTTLRNAYLSKRILSA